MGEPSDASGGRPELGHLYSPGAVISTVIQCVCGQRGRNDLIGDRRPRSHWFIDTLAHAVRATLERMLSMCRDSSSKLDIEGALDEVDRQGPEFRQALAAPVDDGVLQLCLEATADLQYSSDTDVNAAFATHVETERTRCASCGVALTSCDAYPCEALSRTGRSEWLRIRPWRCKVCNITYFPGFSRKYSAVPEQGGRRKTEYTYYKLCPDLLESKACSLRYLQVKNSLWVDIRFIELHIHYAAMAGVPFTSLETLVQQQSQAEGAECPKLKDTFATAWKLYAMVSMLCSPDWEDASITISTYSGGGVPYDDGLEDCMKQLIAAQTAASRRTADFHHISDVPGCGGCVQGARCSAIVIDGMEAYTGDVCAHEACRQRPLHRRRFCGRHAALEPVCGVRRPLGFHAGQTPSRQEMTDGFLPEGPHGEADVQGVRCTNRVQGNSSVCGAPLCRAVYGTFGRVQQTPERGPRERRYQLRLRELEWQRINAQQRLKRKALVGHFFAVCPCGTVLGHFPMESPENGQDVLRFLDEDLYSRDTGERLPDIVLYDRACIVTRSFQQGNSLAAFAERWCPDEGAPQWRVDRFHFLGHSADDEHCRLNCNPFAPGFNPGMVIITEVHELSLPQVINVLDAGRPEETDEFVRTGRVIGHHQIECAANVKAEVREHFMTTQDQDRQELQWLRAHALHVVNTEIAESKFAQLRKCISTLRSLSPFASQLFLAFKVDHMNQVTLSCLRGQSDPVGIIGSRWMPCQTIPLRDFSLEF